MAPPFFLVLLLILAPIILSATAPVFVHPKPNKIKRHKAVKHRTILS